MRILFLLLLLPFFGYTGEIVRCAPTSPLSIAASVQSVRDGDWHTGSTWSNGVVPSEADDITFSHNITATKNIVIRGKLSASKGKITFLGINERNFVGSGMEVLATDIGLWVMGSSQLQLIGEAKRSWTTLQGSAVRGATVISVANADGWKMGDVLVVVPTEKPLNNFDWNDATNQPIDPMIAKFERRTITAINGNNITLNAPLAYDHLLVTSTVAGKTWTAEVENLTRSIVIEGTSAGRSHIYIRSNRPQTIKFVEGRFLGPRTPGYRAGNLVNGRYGLHFHHCMDGSFGSVVEGNAFHDLGNRGFVPHVSNGITLKNNVVHSMLEQPFWWDFQDRSHYISLDGNISSLRVYNGVNAGSVTGIELGQGDNNSIVNNVAVYIHHGDQHQQGAYSWNTDNVGVWIFRNNLAHSNVTGLFVWQNDNANHVNEDYNAYNNILGMHHGAYLNEYNYIGGVLYNSLLSVEATQASTTPMFNKMILDGGGKIPHLVRVLSSPVTAGQANQWRDCTFEGFTAAAFDMRTEFFAEADGRKIVEIINPTHTNPNLTSFSSTSIYNSFFRVQPKTGQSYQVTQAGRTNINSFALNSYGTGGGLFGRYYNGATFNAFAFDRTEPVKFQQWSVDKGASPDGVHHRIKPGGPYSATWTGFYEPQITGQTQFAASSYGGIRVYVEDRLVIDRWAESQESAKIDGSLIALELGRRYKIKVEHFDAGGQRGVSLFTKRNGQYFNVPIYQLYAADPGIPVDTIVRNRPPVVSAGTDVTTKDTIIKVEGTAVDPDNNLKTIRWTGVGVVLDQTLSEAAHVLVKAKPGVYSLTLTATDALGLSARDSMTLTVTGSLPPDTLFADAGPDHATKLTEVTLDGSRSRGASAVNWYKQSGPASWNFTSQNSLVTKANRLTAGVYVFRLKVTARDGRISEDRVTVTVGVTPVTFQNTAQSGSATCIDGTVLTHTVPAGKYTAITQATADAMAIQEVNTELAKCPLPWFSVILPSGKTLYLFGTEENPKIIIK